MAATHHKLLTIVIEAAIERPVTAELEAAGVSGFTIVEARGAGHRGKRRGDWDQSRNLRIETITDEDTAKKLSERLLAQWSENYAIVLWLQEVEVLRRSKFDVSEG